MGGTVQDSREALRRLFRNDQPERMGTRELSIWPETLDRWVAEGYPTEEVAAADGSVARRPIDWVAHLGFDSAEVGGWFDALPLRGFSEVEAETDEWQVTRNGAGAALKFWKHKYGTPEHIDFRMTSREVWQRDYRPHLLQPDRERVNVVDARTGLAERRGQGLWTMFGHLFVWENMRQSLGDVCLYESMLLDPGWIHDYCRVYTGFFQAHYRLLFAEAGLPDGVCMYEDLGYNKGLFCSPRLLADLLFPYYREMIDFFHGYGLHVELHSCGNVTEALPLIVEAGFDSLNPMEAKAGCDLVAFARDYGDSLAFCGGFDVRVLESGDRALIAREIARIANAMKDCGGRYLFGTDHSISPRVGYDDYRFALDTFRQQMWY
jgi:uroporphyrinogen decarboxylase